MKLELNDVVIKDLFRIPHVCVQSGEKILIRGPSGHGKTTLLHLMAGILQPTKGSVFLRGENIHAWTDSRLSAFRRRQVGLIYQQLNLISHLTVLENIRLLEKDDPNKVAKALSLLDRLDLSEKGHQVSHSLSLGEQQRVAVGRLLLQAPAMMLADEPTSSLDRFNTEQVMRLLVAGSVEKTLVVVSHDERIENYFDRVVDLQDWVQDLRLKSDARRNTLKPPVDGFSS